MSLKLRRRKNSPNWIMRGSVGGFRVEESTRTTDKRIAEEIRAKRELDFHAERIYGKKATATFAHAAVSYLESGGSRRFLAPILDHFGTTPLTGIDQDALDAGARKLFPQASPATRVRQFYTPVSAVLHHAAQRGWCDKPIIARPKQNPARIRWIELEEAERLISACGEHLRPLVIFMLYTGARVGEALWLDWRNVDLSRAHVQFLKTKNNQPRGVPLHPRVVTALASLPNREGAVFRRPDGKPYSALNVNDDSDTSAGSKIKSAFHGACKRAGIENFHPHDCRHTFATWHYRANHDLAALQKLGGWKTLSMVMRYAHTNVAEHAHTINRLPGGNLGDSSSDHKKII
jgi:integrase